MNPIQGIFSVSDDADFRRKALEIFRFQYDRNPVYKRFCDLTDRPPQSVKRIEDIPFLPVEFFKYFPVVSAPPPYDAVFESSGTTGMQRSRHYVKDLQIYRQSYATVFEMFYGPPSDWVILALLPSYLERNNSSLIHMMRDLVSRARPGSGFYLYNYDALYRRLQQSMDSGEKILLFGVSFALWDFAERYRPRLSNTVVMETGGMKGRKREPVREELHALLKEYFGISSVHSEYGMTELLSQAYSYGEGLFSSPPWMRVLIRDTEDPFDFTGPGKTGGINIIDLANVYSCSFLATRDLGKMHSDGRFEILGRFDNSDIRGCNLLLLE